MQGWDISKLYTSGVVTVTNTVPGDFNRDGHVNAADIPAMLAALVDLNAFKSRNGLTNSDFLSIGDVNGSGAVDNADLIALIGLLRAGGGSVTAVPEPPAFHMMLVFAVIGCIASIAHRRRVVTMHANPRRTFLSVSSNHRY